MTECARCGCCCDPVTVSFNPQVHATNQLASPEAHRLDQASRYNYEFMVAHWRVTSGPHDTTEDLPGYKVACDQYDRGTRSCMAQSSKPAICSGFPWYGREPTSPDNEHLARALDPRCSFNADVRTMLPLTPVSRPPAVESTG